MDTRALLTVLLKTTRAFHTINQCARRYRASMASNNVVPCDFQALSVKSYENAIRLLNSLQTNSQILASISKDQRQSVGSLQATIVSLERGGLSLTQLDTLNVIHVSGTKGKGTTCAFVESILRNSGLRTGFFSSPHLVAVRERIRLDGKPLSEQKFTKYFFELYERMLKLKTSDDDMPFYFRFLTCMAYYVFYHEKVDVAIMEVGIGGTNDSTNIVRKPKVVGITSMGLDHQNILGNTIEEITAQKAGIMKPNVPAITVHNHSPEVFNLLKSYAELTQCPLYTAPPLQEYSTTITLGVDDGQVSRTNAGLAIQIANTFLSQCSPSKLRGTIPSQTEDSGMHFEAGKVCALKKWHLEGLKNCSWYGRFQVLQPKENLCYYLDGAHTDESLKAARNWFLKMTRKDSLRVLVFYLTGNRDAEKLLKPLAGSFDLAIFSPLVVATTQNYKANPDNWLSTRSGEDEMSTCQVLASTWETLASQTLGGASKAIILNSITAVLLYLDSLSNIHCRNGATPLQLVPDKSYQNVNVLFTGSLHMIGTVLSVLQPEAT